MTDAWEREVDELSESIANELSVGVVRKQLTDDLLALEVATDTRQSRRISVVSSRYEVIVMIGRKRHELGPLPESRLQVLQILKSALSE
jgi:hypothetical protein